MTHIFEIEDKSGRKIHLSDERWKHLNQEHPEVAPYLEDIKETLKNPLKIITAYEFDENVKYYYKYFKEREAVKYLLVVFKQPWLCNHSIFC